MFPPNNYPLEKSKMRLTPPVDNEWLASVTLETVGTVTAWGFRLRSGRKETYIKPTGEAECFIDRVPWKEGAEITVRVFLQWVKHNQVKLWVPVRNRKVLKCIPRELQITDLDTL